MPEKKAFVTERPGRVRCRNPPFTNNPSLMKRKPAPKKLPTQIEAQFAQTISEQSCTNCPLFYLIQAENKQK